jgi:hypothetical protein
MALPEINAMRLSNEIDIGDDIPGASFFSIQLPDDGDHFAHLRVGDRGVTVDNQRDKETGQKTGAPYVALHLVAELFAEDGTRTGTLFDNPNSVLMQTPKGRTSRLAGILDIVGSPVPRGTRSPEAYKEHVEVALADGPEAVVVSRWEASAKAESAEEVEAAIAAGYLKAGKAKVGDYYTFLKGQRNFPENEDGSRSPEVTNPISGETVQAQVRIVRYKQA